MKKWIFRILKLIALFSIVFFVSFSVYVRSTVAETSIESLEEKMKEERDSLQSAFANVVLEEGSVVNRAELEAFYLFSAERIPFNIFFSDNTDSKAITNLKSKIPGLLQVNKEVQFKNLISNDCSDVYCYQHYLSFEHMPAIFWKGLIGVEDKRYLDHMGVDFISIARAFVANVKNGRFSQGGSTISQQLVKNLFLTSEKTFSRKIKEMITSFYLETKISKEKILEAYLNEVNWGALQGIRIKGVHAASLFYFGKRPEDITPFEGAILIGMLKGPAFYSPLKHLDRLKERARIVFDKLVEEKLVPKDVKQVWTASDWKKFNERLLRNEKDRSYQSLWRTLNDHEQSILNYEKFVLIQKVQNVRSSIFEKLKDKKSEEHFDSIAVKVLLGPIDNNQWFSYYSKVERNKERALKEERHQIGSTIKPILYGIFVDNGKRLSDRVSTDEINLNLKSGKWSPKEAHEIKEKEVFLSEALLRSYNRPVVRLSSEIGFEKVEQALKEIMPKLKTPLAEFPAELLGSTELSVFELKEIYLNFIKSECNKLSSFTRLTDDSVLHLLSDPNQTTVLNSVDEIMQGLRFFGKTGTTNKGYDNWYVAFDGKNISIIWVGYEGMRKTNSLGLYGATTAFNVFQNYYRDRGRRFAQFGCDNLK